MASASGTDGDSPHSVAERTGVLQGWGEPMLERDGPQTSIPKAPEAQQDATGVGRSPAGQVGARVDAPEVWVDSGGTGSGRHRMVSSVASDAACFRAEAPMLPRVVVGGGH